MNFLATLMDEIWLVLVSMAPYLLFGFLAAGILSELISKDFVRRHLGGRGLMQSVKAAVVGVPMPVCSCGVIPLAASLRDHGASRGATASFLASTPQTGVDSLMVTYALLGLPFAVFRAVAAFVSGIICGTAVQAVTTTEEYNQSATLNEQKPETSSNWRNKAARMFKYGFISLPGNISGALIVGIILSGLISSLIPENYFSDRMGGLGTSMLLMLLVGTPLYVCSSASVPIALAFIKAGIEPGAALVFLIMGPATNAATFATLWNIIGKKQLAVFMITLMSTAIGSGLLMNQMEIKTDLAALVCNACECADPSQILWAVLLILVLLQGYAKALFRKFVPRKEG